MNTATLSGEEVRTDLYPSRGAMKGGIVPRKHPVVWARADAPAPVDRALVDRYERDGFLVLRDVFKSEEVARLQAELHRLRLEAETLHRPEVITEKDSRQVRSIFKFTNSARSSRNWRRTHASQALRHGCSATRSMCINPV